MAVVSACLVAVAWTCLFVLVMADHVGRSANRWLLPALIGSVSVTVLALVATRHDGRNIRRLLAWASMVAMVSTGIWGGGTAALRASDGCLEQGSLATPYRLDIGLDPFQGGVSCRFTPDRGDPTRVLVPLHELLVPPGGDSE